MEPTVVTTVARLLLPLPLRSALRRWHRAAVLDRAMQAVLRNPQEAVRSPVVLKRLVYGWGNESWSAREEYLTRIVEAATGSRYDILECGSGLSTLLLGAVARKAGVRVWALEHSPEWRQRVCAAIEKYGLAEDVTVLDTPIQPYGDYDWYSVPPALTQARFGLAICDGPPGDTRGGRYGLLPVLREGFVPGAVVLLDDAARPEEQATLTRWAAETGRAARLRDGLKPYAELTLSMLCTGVFV
jgi:Methyltransferase domain